NAPRGALIGSVMPGEPADKGGVKAGDVITAVDGRNVEDSGALLRAIAEKKPGAKTALTVWRNGASRTVTVELGERTPEQLNAQRGGPVRPGKKQEAASLGLSVRPVTAEEARALKLENGQGLMIVGVAPDKPAADVDLRDGDVIIAANLKPVKDVATLSKIVKEEGAKRGAVLLQINRRGDVFFRTVLIGK
ncbi:MAG: PDZ domain-containing protein, partial [Desulfovibrionaceae bacterium]|nr:PDZ domain-containing protein [Desulfovibrionaceae bacterium]